MILQRLAEFYNRVADDPVHSAKLPKPGYSLQKVSFCVVLNPDGSLQQFQSLLDEGGKKAIPQAILVPGQAKPSGSGINPGFLWDNAAYVLGFVRSAEADDDSDASKRKIERALDSFAAFREKHLALRGMIGSPLFSAVCRFLEDWRPERAHEHERELADIAGSFGVFRLAGEQKFVHDDLAVLEYWSSSLEGETGVLTDATCLVTGKRSHVSRLHEPKIKGVRGAQPAGALLVSFNEDAYTSFGREQSLNAPVSTDATFRYTNALNHLLSRGDRRVSLGDSTVVFWAERRTQLEDFVSDLIGDGAPVATDASAEDIQRTEQARTFVTQLREGHAGAEALDPDSDTRFYILGLAPNAARVSVRFWIDSSVGEMKAHLGQHLRDTELAGQRDLDRPLTIRRIVDATGRAESEASGRFRKYDSGAVSPLLAGAIAQAVLTGGAYPQALLGSMIRRLRADGFIRHERIAAIKACLVRGSRLRGDSTEVLVALNTDRKDPAYLTGRLFALLEKIQTDSTDGELNRTIRDSFYSSASATPGVVFPRLLRLGQHHLARMGTGQKIFYERQLGQVVNQLEKFPRHLRLEEQGMFAIGYFHQRQDLFTRKDKQEKIDV